VPANGPNAGLKALFMSEAEGEKRELTGDYAGADDLLWAAQSGSLTQLGTVRVKRSGLAGPLVEMLFARRANPGAFAQVEFAAPFAASIEQAIVGGTISGDGYKSRHGVFPLCRFAKGGDGADRWSLWCSRAEQAGCSVGLPGPFAAAVIGAMGELQDNVAMHSRRAETGLVVYAATSEAFEIVVADCGVGVLASLQENAAYADLADAGAALKIAVQDGETRFGHASGHGFGMGQMFRALADHDGELRFRSGDHALTVRGQNPSLQSGIELAHKARLVGLTIGVRCRTPNGALRRP
jgi:hypothetical protein